jgi:hypothetical protein
VTWSEDTTSYKGKGKSSVSVARRWGEERMNRNEENQRRGRETQKQACNYLI